MKPVPYEHFPLCFHGCDTWSLKLKEEYRLKVFAYRVLGEISGWKTDETVERLEKIRQNYNEQV
jgi:hypothetical protein